MVAVRFNSLSGHLECVCISLSTVRFILTADAINITLVVAGRQSIRQNRKKMNGN